MKTASKTPSKPTTLPMLVEIGCEEIPARFLDGAQKGFGECLRQALTRSLLLVSAESHEPRFKTYSTPRRLVVHFPEILSRQPDQVERVQGPPAKVAFDATGKPTRAAESFAQKHRMKVKDLVRVNTPKGEYVVAETKVQGQPAWDVLPSALKAALGEVNFPKSMYWEVAKFRFVRPIRWLVAILGEGRQARIIPFEIAGVKSGNQTYGHRTGGRKAITVLGFMDYAKKLRKAHVEIDPALRRETVKKECKEILDNLKLKVIEDKDLESWIVSSTEWPMALLGAFEDRFLNLPREILLTVMRDHQKYFGVEDGKSKLQPRFVAVLNLDPGPNGLIRRGQERVLAARFTDAEFFWKADQRLPLDKRQELLAGVTYQAELGSYADKLGRMKTIAQDLCGVLKDHHPNPEFRDADTEWAMRAVELSKSDLTTQMVQEFPELQGIVGGLYAHAQGYPAVISDAIYDQYLPQSLEGRPPRNVGGAVVSLADKIDGVASGFAVGHEPTGSSDPFALRRQGNGIIKVLLELSLPISLKEVFEHALTAFDIAWRKPRDQVFGAVLDFLRERLRYYLETVRSLRYDTVRAVLAAGWDPPVDALLRAEALERMRGADDRVGNNALSARGSEDIEALCVAAKRIKNILTKSASANDWQPGQVDTGLLEQAEERSLFTALVLEGDKATKLRASGNYVEALEATASLRSYVDRFFDKVLVMAEDRGVRENRLRLLWRLDELFSSIAHFAEIAPAPAHVDASTSKPVTRRKTGDK